MKIYTKTGDQGSTGLSGGERVPKSDPRVSAYGILDEANSCIGVVNSMVTGYVQTNLVQIQKELFQIGSELATSDEARKMGKNSSVWISDSHTSRLEAEIDAMEKKLNPLESFILPGGVMSAATLHVARTIVRKAERECVALIPAHQIRPEVIRYLNRLSDYLFVCARFVNQMNGASEVKWLGTKLES